MERLFTDLGKQYYVNTPKRGIQIPEEYRTQFSCIDEVKEEILSEENEQLAKEGKKRCPSCGVAVIIESRFCNMCGHSFDKKNEKCDDLSVVSRIGKCSKCGTVLDDDAVFCSNCGQKNE